MNPASTTQPSGGMDIFPVASREARVAARKILSYDIRSIIAGLFVAVAFRRIFAPAGDSAGAALLQTLAFMGYLYATIAGAFKTFDTLSREKREGTLGLLLLTDLKPFQILFGKLLSASALTVFGLLAFLPILSIPLILGGVIFEQYIRFAATLITALLLSMSWGLYISATARNYVASLTGAAALIFIFAFLPMPAATTLNANVATFPTEILTCLFSPALPFALASSANPDLLQFFWPSILGNLLLAFTWFAAAVTVLPLRCHEAPGKSKLLEALRRRLHEFRFGSARQRAQIRERLLELNPLYWLAHRDRVSSLGLITLCILTLTAAQACHVPQLGLFIASLAILFRMAHASSHSISEDQKNGALELLLSTSLAVDEIVDGLNRAMLRRFKVPVALVILWPWFFIVPHADGLFTNLLVCSSVLLIATWVALSWVGPWFALRKNPTLAAWTSLAVVVLPPWLIWIASIFPGLFDPGYNDIQFIGAIVCSLVGVFHCILVTRWAREILCRNFRAAAADPFGKIRFEPIISPPNFTAESALTVVPIGKGHVEIYSEHSNASITLIATPRERQTFLGWGGDIRGAENPLHLELQGKAFIYARFSNHP